MMDWWRRNKVHFDRVGILPQSTVCVAASPQGAPTKFGLSQERLTRAILRHSLEPEKPFKYGSNIEELLIDVVTKTFLRMLRFFSFKESKLVNDILKDLDVKGSGEVGGMTKKVILQIARKLEDAKVAI